MKTILIVEDTDLNIDLLTQLLEDDYTLFVANDGAAGVKMALETKPDLILMDMSLPILDGYEATREIRKSLATTPIIGLSAHAMDSQIIKARDAGCSDYLTKPVDENKLFEMLGRYLGASARS